MKHRLQEKEERPWYLPRLNTDQKRNPSVGKVVCTEHSLHRLAISPFKSGFSLSTAPNAICNLDKIQMHFQSTSLSLELGAAHIMTTN